MLLRTLLTSAKVPSLIWGFMATGEDRLSREGFITSGSRLRSITIGPSELYRHPAPHTRRAALTPRAAVYVHPARRRFRAHARPT